MTLSFLHPSLMTGRESLTLSPVPFLSLRAPSTGYRPPAGLVAPIRVSSMYSVRQSLFVSKTV